MTLRQSRRKFASLLHQMPKRSRLRDEEIESKSDRSPIFFPVHLQASSQKRSKEEAAALTDVALESRIMFASDLISGLSRRSKTRLVLRLGRSLGLLLRDVARASSFSSRTSGVIPWAK